MENAERKGTLKPGMRAVEFTAGSTGSSLLLGEPGDMVSRVANAIGLTSSETKGNGNDSVKEASLLVHVFRVEGFVQAQHIHARLAQESQVAALGELRG